MCGRVIQNSGPLRYAFVDGMTVRDSRVHNYPPRWNAAPSQELLVIRRNHRTGEVSLDPLRWGLIPHWCNDPSGGRKPINAKCETVRNLPRRAGAAVLHGHQQQAAKDRREAPAHCRLFLVQAARAMLEKESVGNQVRPGLQPGKSYPNTTIWPGL
jgi:hypothetical protein